LKHFALIAVAKVQRFFETTKLFEEKFYFMANLQ